MKKRISFEAHARASAKEDNEPVIDIRGDV